MTHRTNRLLCAAGTAALLVPAAAGAKPGGDHGHHAKAPKAHNAVFQGTLVSADATAGTAVVHVVKANKWGRALVGQDVTFDLTHTRVHVRDVNQDGKRDLNDTAANDRVSVQAKVAKDAPQPFAARQFQDHGQPKPEPADGDPGSAGDDSTPPAGS